MRTMIYQLAQMYLTVYTRLLSEYTRVYMGKIGEGIYC